MSDEVYTKAARQEQDIAFVDTLPKALRNNYRQFPEKDAIRVKDKGIWVTYSWKDYYQNVKYFCLGLLALGLE